MKVKNILKVMSAGALFALAAVIFCSCSGTSGSPESDTAQESQTETETQAQQVTYEPLLDENGREIGKKVISPDGKLQYTEKWDTKGRTVEAVTYNENEKVDAEEYLIYAADSDEVAQYKTVKYYYNETSGEFEQYNESLFNSLKQMTDSFSYRPDGSLISFVRYEYDETGNKTREANYNSGYSLTDVSLFEYDSMDRLVKTTQLDDYENVLAITLYEYNENGTASKVSECDPDGSVRNYCQYVYNEDGSVAEEQIFVSDGEGGFVRYN